MIKDEQTNKISRDKKGRFIKGHAENSKYSKGYNKKSWFKKGHKGIISKGGTGCIPVNAFQKGIPSWNKGKSMVHGGTFKKGEKHFNWQGGISKYPSEFSKKLKHLIRKRDAYTCKECGYTQKQLNYSLSVHHIDYDKNNNELSNLISLCRSCHAQTGFNRTDWINYLRKKI